MFATYFACGAIVAFLFLYDMEDSFDSLHMLGMPE